MCETDVVHVGDYVVCYFNRVLFPGPIFWEVDADSVMQHFMAALSKTQAAYLDNGAKNLCDSSFFFRNPYLRYKHFDLERIASVATHKSEVITIVPVIHLQYSNNIVAIPGGMASGGHYVVYLNINIFAFCNGKMKYYRSHYKGTYTDDDIPVVSDSTWQRVVGEVMQDFIPGRLPGAEPWQGRKRKRR
jgi:hypothetical protein